MAQVCRTCRTEARPGERVGTVMRKVKGKIVPIDFCRNCGGGAGTHKKVSTFPFTVPFGLDGSGQPLVVNSLYDLRKKERQYGVQAHAYNMQERSFDEPPQSRQQPSW